MKILSDCLPCMLRQALTAARKAGCSESAAFEITEKAAALLSKSSDYSCAPELCRMIHHEVKQLSSCTDPYYDDKCREIGLASAQLDTLRGYVESSENPLRTALKIAAVGNIIDAAVDGALIPEKLRDEIIKPFELCRFESFSRSLEGAKTLLYIGDNSGEAVFDTVLLKQLQGIKIYYAVRSAPVLNDVDMHTAVLAGVDRYAKVISSGCASPGCIYGECSDEFREIFNSADIVLAKGQGNYEGLSESGRKVFFLLKAKCPVLAAHLGVPMQSYVLTD